MSRGVLAQELRRGHGVLRANHVERVQHRSSLERRAAGQELVEDGAQGILVGGGPYLLGIAPRLFGSHVAGRAQDRARACLTRIALQPLHQPEIGDLGSAVGREEDIARFEVAVDHLVLVRHVHRTGQDFDDPGGLIDRLGLAVNLLSETAASQVFEREIGQAVVFADLEDLDDVGVFDRGDGLRLDLEPGEILGPSAWPRRGSS